MKKTKFYLLTIDIFRIELIIYPILFILQYGIGLDIQASFYLRFFYIAYFLIAFFYLLKTRKIYINLLSLIFSAFFLIAFFKGFWRQQFNLAFLSHTFYYLMPIVMISYGKNFGIALVSNSNISEHFLKVIKNNFYIGSIAVICFSSLSVLGMATYDAIDIWNLLISLPYYLFYGMNGYIIFIIIMIILSGKRVALVVGFVMFSYSVMGNKNYVKYIMAGLILTLFSSILYIMYSDIQLPDFRVFRALSYAQIGEFDLAFAGRLSESLEAINILLLDPTGIIFGAGLGGEFYPWPDLDGAENYISHYTHFTFISYMWIGGIVFPCAVYIILFSTLFKIQKIVIAKFNIIFFVICLYLLMAIVSSLSGAVLMNNSFLWLMIGASIGLGRADLSKSLIHSRP